MTRLTRLLALALTLLVVGAAGCTPPPRPPNDLLRVIVSAEPGNLNPWQYSSVVDRHVLFNIYDHVTFLDLHDFQIKPEIAESWETAPDGLTFTLHVRQGVRFQSGKPLTSRDVAYSIDQARSPQASRTSGFLSAVTAVETPDDHTVRLRLSRPDTLLPSTLADVLVAPVGFGEADKNKPDGTGPFVLADWQHGRQVTLRRSDSYWGTPPAVDTVTMQVVTDQATALMQMQADQADMVDQLGFSQIGQARRFGLDLAYPEQGQATGVYTLFLNTQTQPFDDVRVRQALSKAIDRQSMELFLRGVYRPLSNPIPRTSPAFNPDAPSYDHRDLDGARRLMAEAGHADGVEGGEIVVYSNLGIDFIMAAQAIQQQAAEAGIRFTIRQAEIASWSDQVIKRKQFTAALGAVVPMPTDYDLFAGTYAKANGAITGWQNTPEGKEFWAALDQARAQTSQAGFDEAMRQLQVTAQTNEHSIAVGQRNIPVAVAPAVHGFVASPQQYLLLKEVSVRRD